MGYNDRHEVYFRYATQKYNKALRDQVAPLIDYITEDNVMLLDLTLDGLIKRDPISKAMRDVYVSILPREAVAIAKEVDRNLPKDKKVNGIGFFSSYWKRWIQQAYLTLTSDMITNITETTKDKIRQLLSNGREQNLSYRGLAKYMTDELKRDDFTRSRSLTIARTESTRAANIGQQQMAQTSNIVLNKKWEGRDDGRERATHIAASRQEPIPKDEPFIVGGFPMQYPGDRSAPASESVNCRCSMIFVPVLDEDGLPVRRSNGMERDLFG